PCHANEEPPVMAEIRRPPVLAVRHKRGEIFLQSLEVELPELLGVVEVLPHGIGLGRVLAENPEVQLVRPPVAVRPHSHTRGAVRNRALARFLVSLCVHVSLRSCCSFLRAPFGSAEHAPCRPWRASGTSRRSRRSLPGGPRAPCPDTR